MQHKSRVKQTIKLMGDIKGKVLDVGGSNELRIYLCQHYPYETAQIYGTIGDLDGVFRWRYEGWFDHVIMSHVLEHLIDPLNVFQGLDSSITKDTLIHVFLPHQRYRFLDLSWDEHYHEMTRSSFKMLCDKAGYEILYSKVHKSRSPLWKRFTGFRPTFRIFFAWNIYYRLRKK